MSVRLLTTPWFTKNLAGGVDTERSPLIGARGERVGWYRRWSAARTSKCTAEPEAARIIRAMLLAIDIGNTNITLGLVRTGSLVAVRRAITPTRTSPDEGELLLDGLLRLDDRACVDVSAVRGAAGD